MLLAHGASQIPASEPRHDSALSFFGHDAAAGVSSLDNPSVIGAATAGGDAAPREPLVGFELFDSSVYSDTKCGPMEAGPGLKSLVSGI